MELQKWKGKVSKKMEFTVVYPYPLPPNLSVPVFAK
jgi:hypothetical protein